MRKIDWLRRAMALALAALLLCAPCLAEAADALQAGAENPSTLITGIAVARADFIEQHPEAVKQFMDDYRESVIFAQQNVADAAQLIGKFDIFEAGPAEKALPYCNITFIDGEDLKTRLSGYLEVLFEADPASVGGALPGEDFYY